MKYFGRAEGVARAKIVLPEVKKDGVCAMFPPKSWRGKSWREMRPKAENRASFAPVEIYLGISIEHWTSAGYENCDVCRQASPFSMILDLTLTNHSSGTGLLQPMPYCPEETTHHG
jgi:hypothetical protein